MNAVLRVAELRLDGSRIARTPAGGVRVPAVVSRSCVVKYRQPDGSVIREYRPLDEVANPDSVQSLADAPVTLLHSVGVLTAEAWKKHSVGHQSGELRVDSGEIHTALVIADAGAAESVTSKKLTSVSCAYTAVTDPTPGVSPEGEPYDVVQRNIRYNNISLGPPGWGRQGDRVALRLDGQGHAILAEEKRIVTVKIKLDGKIQEVEIGSADHIRALEAEVQDLKKERDTATARLDGLTVELTKTKAELVAAPATIRKELAARSALETQARTVLGPDVKLDGSDDDIRVAVIRATDPQFDPTGKESAYLAARYDFALTAKREAPNARLSPHVKTDGVTSELSHAERYSQAQARAWIKGDK